jgi:CheY-like chemotaxis protein
MENSFAAALCDRAAIREPVDESKLRVVIIEDSAIIRARLSESLSEISNLAIVGQAESEAEALALLRACQWDAVVLDLQLKEGTGLGVLKTGPESRHANARSSFTNYAFPQYRDRSLSLGADYFSTNRANSIASGTFAISPRASHAPTCGHPGAQTLRADTQPAWRIGGVGRAATARAAARGSALQRATCAYGPRRSPPSPPPTSPNRSSFRS